MRADARMPAAAVPLCVDLDGTLIKTDLLVESFFLLLKRQPWVLLKIPIWLMKGKAYLKEQIAKAVDIDPELLPYDAQLLQRLREEKEKGRPLVLVTASHRKFAESVQSHLSLFHEVHATEGKVNLSAERKKECLVDRFGHRGFDYVGNEKADIPVWAAARESWLVDVSPGIRRAAESMASVTTEFRKARNSLGSIVQVLRLHQWLKNILIFVPMIAAHRAAEIDTVFRSLVAFVAYGLCASSVYLLNDLLDLPSDRRHPRKRFRSLASGSLHIMDGVILIPLLLCVSAALSLVFLPLKFCATLAIYYLVTLVYSFWAKERVGIDVLFLTGLYTMRLIAGGAATSVELSFWLLAFSTSLFLSLAFIKRYSEMLTAREAGQTRSAGRGYSVDDMGLIQSMGVAAGYASVLVLALYINSPEVKHFYSNPKVLWSLCPILLLWISRAWIKTYRGEMPDDPVVFAAKDRPSQIAALIMATAFWWAV